MKNFLVLLAFAKQIAQIGALDLQRSMQRLTAGTDGPSDKVHPVSRVVELLKDTQAQLEQEADADEEAYEKHACWCEVNDKGVTKEIADAQARVVELSSAIERLAATASSLGVEISNLEAETAKNQQALDEATALRKKQAAEFTEEEKEMIESIRALDAAITVLSKHHTPAVLASVAATVSAQLSRHSQLLRAVVTPKQRHALTALAQERAASALQQPGDYYDATPTFKQAYQPQSGEIFGILQQMKETFEMNLSDSQKEELENQRTYADLKAAKEEQIRLGQEAIAEKKQQMAKTHEDLAHAKADRDDTSASLNADQAFLSDLKVTCSMTDKDWEDRQKTRQEELAAVAQAIAILSSDDARDLFSRTFNPSFVVLSERVHSFRREKAAKVLSAAAAKTGDAALASMAHSVMLDPFTKVKQAIDDMVAQLHVEMDDEVKHKDYCVEELHKNEASTERATHERQGIETRISGLEASIKSMSDEMDALNASIADMLTEQKRANEDRQREHAEFQGVLADQRETQQILQQAVDVLKRVYAAKAESAELLQAGAPAPAASGPDERESVLFRATPPPPMNSYERNRGGGSIVALIEHIIANAAALESDALHAEQQAQDAHTRFLEETTKSIEAKRASLVDKKAEKAAAEQELTQAKGEHSSVLTELEDLSSSAGALHSSCDFTLKNFDIRQEARAQEIAALKEAKAYLSGMQASG
eukprot:CAMPEP_0178402682 /NCGR_PEP_ID=MMETSP0689_2-20121128/16972_1 /TAXON_ID=160604 /ORGANISM="Amphidinium massartii, Strain CS-259" /LENGTH=709 /DNA_ID=CAMNT_0020023599 /DNA_START=89 /DNA_END=2218 /DNA_ORIENTATION=+